MLHKSLKFIVPTVVTALRVSYFFDPKLFTLRSGIHSIVKAFSSSRRLLSANTQNMSTDWHEALKSLPATPEKIPAFFFAHGSPMLVYPPPAQVEGLGSHMGSKGPLAQFLAEFGPALLKKYKPKGIVVFSAHWETLEERQGMFRFRRLNVARVAN